MTIYPNSYKLTSDDFITAEQYNKLRDDCSGPILGTWGGIIFMGSIGLEGLNPGSANQFLKTQGSAMDPIWDSP